MFRPSPRAFMHAPQTKKCGRRSGTHPAETALELSWSRLDERKERARDRSSRASACARPHPAWRLRSIGPTSCGIRGDPPRYLFLSPSPEGDQRTLPSLSIRKMDDEG